MEILRVEELNFSYPDNSKKTLDNISFSVEEGDFVLLSGQSGCGKSTLVRHLKPKLIPYGIRRGNIYYYSKDIRKYPERKIASEIGYIFQNPDAQIVTDKVWNELAFGLENIGLDTQKIRLRVAEMASFFGIQGWFRKNISDLSGGQKQILNLAAIMVMQPKILILDEPTSQLDPIASNELINTLVKINQELSTTIILIEHNLEEVYSICDKVVIMEKGKILYYDTPNNVIHQLFKSSNTKYIKSLPTATKIYSEIKKKVISSEKYPLTVKDCRRWIQSSFSSNILNNKTIYESIYKLTNSKDRKKAIQVQDLYYQYSKTTQPIIRNLSFEVFEGEIYCILGGNGTGKSTTLSLISKQINFQRGKILIYGKNIKKYTNETLYRENLTLLPQNPQSLFAFETLREDLEEVLIIQNKNKKFIEDEIKRISSLFDIEEILNQHPYDLSGGELQRAAMAKIMLLNPKIILLDEPTKGLDSYYKEQIGNILNNLRLQGMTIIMVTHDIEFSAKYSDRCAMFFDGTIVSEAETREFFNNNNFYTTSANRITRNIFENILIYEDVVKECGLRCLIK